MANHNVIPKLQSKIRVNTKKADTARNQPRMQAWPAWLGDNNGVIFTYNGQPVPTGYVVVRDASGNLSVALNSGATAVSTSTPGIQIWVGYEPLLHPTLFQVLGQRDTYSEQPPLSLQNHHTTHEFPNGDVVNVHSEQILPGLIRGDNGFTLTIYPFFCPVSTGGWVFIPFQTLDMTSYQPAGGAQAFTIFPRDAGTITVVSGTTTSTPELITAANFATAPDATYHPMWAVRLYSGQTVINQSIISQTITPDLFDLRWLQGGAGGSSGGMNALNPTAVKTGAYTAAANDLIPTDASSGSVPIALPSAPADKTLVAVKQINVSGSYTTTITRGGTDVFNKAGGSTSLTLTLLNQAVLLQYYATSGIWYVLADDLTLSALDARYQAAGTYVTSVTGSAPIVSSGSTTPAISINAATESARGSMSASDKSAININKELSFL